MLNLASIEKQALLKIAVDLVKADNRIHRNEVAALSRLQRHYAISNEELDLTHYLSLQQSLERLCRLGADEKEQVLALLDEIVSADNDIDFKENILLSAIKLALRKDSSEWCSIISVENISTECPSDQIIYLEHAYCEEPHKVLDDKYDNLLVTKALNDVGLNLFYLPSVIEELRAHQSGSKAKGKGYDLLIRSMNFIVPTGETSNRSNLEMILGGLDCSTFLRVVETCYHITPDRLPFKTFLMVKIQDGHILDDNGTSGRAVDFLCLDVHEDLKRRILSFVGLMEKSVSLIPYDGYYKLLYDYLSSESKIMSSVVLDSQFDFHLPEAGGVTLQFESSPQARSFYLLLLKAGKAGISQLCFTEALQYLEALTGQCDVEELLSQMKVDKRDCCAILYNLIVLYRNLSTKDIDTQGSLSYISHIIQYRSSLKNYVNKGFSSVPQLADSRQYFIEFDNESKSYRLNIGVSMFAIERESMNIPLSESALWKKLR